MPRKLARFQPTCLDKVDASTRELCLTLLLSGKKGVITEVARLTGVSKQAVSEFKRRHLADAVKLGPAIVKSAEAIGLTMTQAVKATPFLADRMNRLQALQDRHDRMRQVMNERGLDMSTVPGGSTGLLTRQYKQLGSGPNARTVEEYRLDTGLLGEFREHERQMAIELGEWEAGASPTVNVSQVILFPKLTDREAGPDPNATRHDVVNSTSEPTE